MGKFKVGDRVRSITGDMEYVGIVGTIIHDDGSSVPYKIELDKPVANYGDKTIWRTSNGIELVPAWQPKVGDRVRFTKDNPNGGAYYGAKGEVFEVVRRGGEHDGYGPQVKIKHPSHSGWYPSAPISALEPLPVASQAQPLRIVEGRFYKTRDGRKVGPMIAGVWGQVFYDEDRSITSQSWNADGSFIKGSAGNLDLIAEWVDEQPAVPASNDNAAPVAKFKAGDKIRHKDLGNIGYIVSLSGDNCARTFWTSVGWGATDPFEDIELVTPAVPQPTAIVALIENGQPKPSDRPVVHYSAEAATKEAERLAGVHQGQRFGVYVLHDTRETDKPSYQHTWQNLAAAGKKIEAIKELRAQASLDLRSPTWRSKPSSRRSPPNTTNHPPQQRRAPTKRTAERRLLTMRHNAYATNYTRTGKLDMLNRKPFRTAAQKAEARRTARLVNGTHVSNAPVSYHRQAKQQVSALS